MERIREQGRNPWRILAAFLAVASAAWTFYGYLQMPAVERVEQEVTRDDYTLRLGFDYDVTVQTGTLLWEPGTLLGPDRPAYFLAASPLLRVTPFVEIAGATGGRVEGVYRAGVSIRAMDSQGRVLWSDEVRRGSPEPFQLRPAEGTARYEGQEITLDLQNLADRTAAIEEELDFFEGRPGVEVAVDVGLEGEVNGRPLHLERRHTLTVELSGQAVRIPTREALLLEEPVTMTAREKVLVERSPIERLAAQGLPLALFAFASLFLLVELWRGRRRGGGAAPDHRRFKEWITEGKVPGGAEVHVRVRSLEGLVDLAIDLNKRVIYDPDAGSYHVLDEEIHYTYEPEKSAAQLRRDAQPLGELLVKRGLVTKTDIDRALRYQQVVQRPLGECLVALGSIDEVSLYSSLAAQAGLPYLEPAPDEMEEEPLWLAYLSATQAEIFGVLPMGRRPDGRWTVAFSNPFEGGAQRLLVQLLGAEIAPVVARPSAIRAVLEKVGRAGTAGRGRGEISREEKVPPEGTTAPEPGGPDGEEDRAERHAARFSLGAILEAAGFVRGEILADAPRGAALRQWLLDMDLLDADTLQLALGAEKALQAEVRGRGPLRAPGVLSILREADRLDEETAAWVAAEAEREGRAAPEIIAAYHLATSSTLHKVERLREGLLILTGEG